MMSMCTYRSRSFRTHRGLSSSTTPPLLHSEGIFFPPRFDQKYPRLMHLVYHHHLRPTQYLAIHNTYNYILSYRIPRYNNGIFGRFCRCVEWPTHIRSRDECNIEISVPRDRGDREQRAYCF